MNDEFIYQILFIVNYAAFTGVRIYYRTMNLGRESEKEITQKTKAIFFLSFAIIGYFATIILWLVFPQLIENFQINLPTIVRWLGAILAFMATILVFWIHHTLGQHYSAKLEIQKEHQLIQVGPYSKVRHPMYATLNLFSISVSIITANLLIILFAIFVAIPFHWITEMEEKMLIEQFEDEYLQYKKKTGKFIPQLRQSVEND